MYHNRFEDEYNSMLPLEYTGTIHHLKTVQPYYDASESNFKTFEVRRDDRGFAVGDILCLYEWDGAFSTERHHYKQITYALRDRPFVPDGYVCLGLWPVTLDAVNEAKHERDEDGE